MCLNHTTFYKSFTDKIIEWDNSDMVLCYHLWSSGEKSGLNCGPSEGSIIMKCQVTEMP